MKPGTPSPPPDDDASDPLLAALRQRLGDYGQVPPPAAWAAIRQRLPPAPARPWWRRPRRLLPLLALLFSVLAAGLLADTDRRGQSLPSAQRHGHQPMAQRLASRPLLWPKHEPANSSRISRPPVMEAAPATGKALLRGAVAAAPQGIAATPPHGAAARNGRLARVKNTSAELLINAEKGTAATNKPTRYPRFNRNALATRRAAAALAGTSKNSRRPRRQLAAATEPAAIRTLGLARLPGRPAKNPVTALPPADRQGTDIKYITSDATHQKKPYLAYVTHHKQPVYRRHQRLTLPESFQRLATGTKHRRQPHQPAAPRAVAGRAPHRAAQPLASAPELNGLAMAVEPAAQPRLVPGTAVAGSPVDSLAWARPALALASGTLPAALRPSPDSVRPAVAVRRWSVLLLAGPTLSYRTLGPAPTLAAGQPDFARLERPALGFGAQVQVRRVLSGRWALAVGVGYHEYATRLALSVKDTVYRSVHQRDTYKLLTVPVQLSYALGVPRGRLAWGLLAGAEPGWYLGGRSTEGSGCGCEQQVYTSAASSPYRPLSLAFSLGLDVRYRVGGPASRWQWLVQPTGRYVATPFVRSEAVGFTRRQPFSLGLLTGFSWDLR